MKRRNFLFASLLAPFVAAKKTEARRTPPLKDAIVNDDEFFWQNDVCPVATIIDGKGFRHDKELFKSINMTTGTCVVRSDFVDMDFGISYKVIQLPAPLRLVNRDRRIFTETEIQELTRNHDFEMFRDEGVSHIAGMTQTTNLSNSKFRTHEPTQLTKVEWKELDDSVMVKFNQ